MNGANLHELPINGIPPHGPGILEYGFTSDSWISWMYFGVAGMSEWCIGTAVEAVRLTMEAARLLRVDIFS